MQARVDSLRVQLASRKAAFQSRAETENSNSKTRRGRVQHPFTSNSDAAAQKSAWAKAEHKLTKGPTRRVSSHLKGPPSWGLMALTSQKLCRAGQWQQNAPDVRKQYRHQEPMLRERAESVQLWKHCTTSLLTLEVFKFNHPEEVWQEGE